MITQKIVKQYESSKDYFMEIREKELMKELKQTEQFNALINLEI